jgi:hypothetical protein
MTSAWDGWRRFDIPVDRYDGVHSLLQWWYWGLLPATRLASRKILIEQKIKWRTGPALCVYIAFWPIPTIGVFCTVQCMYTCSKYTLYTLQNILAIKNKQWKLLFPHLMLPREARRTRVMIINKDTF